jgi:hypothetical protein
MRLSRTVEAPRGVNRFRDLNAVTLLWIGLCCASFAALGCGDDEGESEEPVRGDAATSDGGAERKDAGSDKGGKGGSGGKGSSGGAADGGKGGDSGKGGAGGAGAGGAGSGGASGAGTGGAGRGGAGGARAGSGGRGGAGGRAAAGSGGSGGARAGTGGSGGAAGTSAAGRGGSGGSGGMAAPYMEPAECKACQDRFPVCMMRRNDCFEAMGTAAAGPKAGAAKKQLCQDALACVNRTKCAELMNGMPDYPTCLCGSGVTLDECVMNGAQGMCKAELAAAAETSMPLDISTRLGDPTYAAGLAIRSAQCAQRYCPKSCGLCATGDTACADMMMTMGPMP